VKETPDPEQLTAEQLSSLLEILEEIVAKATGERPVDMELLRSTIEEAVQCYRVDSWVAREVEKMNIHEIEGPARTVLAILGNDANSGVVFKTLADGDVFEGVRRRTALIADLERLAACAAQHAPRKNLANRPAGIDLRLFVGHLANGWLLLTHVSFTSRWHRNPDSTVLPVSLGAQFVHAVVKVVDSSRLGDLPTAMREVVKRRLRGKYPGYFNDKSRKDAL
jgi:hypothetical protein